MLVGHSAEGKIILPLEPNRNQNGRLMSETMPRRAGLGFLGTRIAGLLSREMFHASLSRPAHSFLHKTGQRLMTFLC